MVAPMNESNLLSPDYDSVVKKDALIPNLNMNNYFYIYFWGVSRELVHSCSLDTLHIFVICNLLSIYIH